MNIRNLFELVFIRRYGTTQKKMDTNNANIPVEKIKATNIAEQYKKDYYLFEQILNDLSDDNKLLFKNFLDQVNPSLSEALFTNIKIKNESKLPLDAYTTDNKFTTFK